MSEQSPMIFRKKTLDRISSPEHLTDYHCKPADIPENLQTAEEQLDYAFRPYGLMRRSITLSEGWHRNAFGPILAFTKDQGLPVALRRT